MQYKLHEKDETWEGRRKGAAGWFDLSFGVRRFRPRCGRVEGKVGVERG